MNFLNDTNINSISVVPNGTTNTTDLISLKNILILQTSTYLIVVAIFWLVFGIYYMLWCYTCQRDNRLFCKVKKRMGYLCDLNNCICTLIETYFASLCWWDGEQIQTRITQNLDSQDNAMV